MRPLAPPACRQIRSLAAGAAASLQIARPRRLRRPRAAEFRPKRSLLGSFRSFSRSIRGRRRASCVRALRIALRRPGLLATRVPPPASQRRRSCRRAVAVDLVSTSCRPRVDLVSKAAAQSPLNSGAFQRAHKVERVSKRCRPCRSTFKCRRSRWRRPGENHRARTPPDSLQSAIQTKGNHHVCEDK